MASNLRLRVFAGPNGSGKSTMYKQVKTTMVGGRAVDLGIYLNPDDIARTLKDTGEFDLKHKLGIDRGQSSLLRFAQRSGLMRDGFTSSVIKEGHRFNGSLFVLVQRDLNERFAQLLTAFLCDLLIRRKQKFSFETVFSHVSKLELMQRATANGYKVYLYFIATNSAEINKDRVQTRVLQGGHDVPPDRIVKRYHLALGQLLSALEACYHAFVFDNSGSEPLMFAEMKKAPHGVSWAWSPGRIPDWFITHYLLASGKPVYESVARMALEERE